MNEIAIESLSPLGVWGWIAAAIFVGGTPAILAAMYFAATGAIDVLPLFTITVTMSLLWDAIWFALGRFVPFERLPERGLFSKLRKWNTGIMNAYGRNDRHWVFFSRFIYGAKSVVSVYAGKHGMHFSDYLWLSFTSIIVWFLLLYGISLGVERELSLLPLSSGALPVYLLITLAIALLARRIAGRLFRSYEK